MKHELRPLLRLAVIGTLSGMMVALSLLPTASPALAGPRGRPIVCTGASQLTMSDPIIITGCKNRMITGGTGDLQGNGPSGSNVLTWKTGKVFTFGTNSITRISPSPCPSGTAEADFKGTVLTTSGKNTKKFVGKPVAFNGCLTVGLTNVVVELVPGTNFTIG